jgi:hypothetical protein
MVFRGRTGTPISEIVDMSAGLMVRLRGMAGRGLAEIVDMSAGLMVRLRGMAGRGLAAEQFPPIVPSGAHELHEPTQSNRCSSLSNLVGSSR